MKKLKRMLGFIVIDFVVTFLFLGSNAFAQGETKKITKLDAVVVTATKQERLAKDTPATITVITSEDIKKSNARTVPEALKGIPGTIIEDNYGLSAEVILRGHYHGKYGYVLVLVDGMPIVSSDTGRVYWEMIPLSNVERIEVVMGPGSALWGGNAFGGTVNIITKKPLAEPELRVSTKVGEYSMNHYSFYGSIMGKEGWLKDLGLQCSFGRKEADGWRYNSSYDNKNYWLKISKDFEDQDAGIDLTLSSSNRYQRVPSTITQAMWDANDLTSPRAESYKHSYHDCDVDYQRLAFEKGIGEFSRIKANLYNRHKEYDYLYTKFTFVDNDTIGGGLQYEFDLGQHSFIFGTDLETSDLDKDTVKKDANYQPDWSTLESRKDIQTDIDKHALYAQDSWKISKTLEAIFGLRWDKAKFDNKGYQYNSGGTIKTDVSGSSSMDGFSPKVNLLYKVNDNLNLYTSIGRAFKIPTPSQLYTSTDYANPNLNAEKATTYEIGAKYFFSDITGSLAFYISEVEDLIVKNAADTQYINVGETEHKGIEGAITYRIMKGLTANLSADYTRAKVKKNASDTSIEGKYLHKVPKYKVSLGLDYTHPKGFFASFAGREIGSSYMDDDNERKYNAYFVADCKLGYKKDFGGSEFSWSVGCNNIFDKKYATRAYTSSSKNYYYPGMPRYFFTEATIRF